MLVRARVRDAGARVLGAGVTGLGPADVTGGAGAPVPAGRLGLSHAHLLEHAAHAGVVRLRGMRRARHPRVLLCASAQAPLQAGHGALPVRFSHSAGSCE